MQYAVSRHQYQGIHHVASFQVFKVLNKCVTLVENRSADEWCQEKSRPLPFFNRDGLQPVCGQSQRKIDYSAFTPGRMHFFGDGTKKSWFF